MSHSTSTCVAGSAAWQAAAALAAGAGRRLAAGLCARLGKFADLFARALERYWLRWHPGYQWQDRYGYAACAVTEKRILGAETNF